MSVRPRHVRICFEYDSLCDSHGATDEFFYYWTVCSRYSHGQMQSARMWSVENEQVVNDVSTALFEVDPSLIADIADFVTRALDRLVALLRERGAVRVPR